MSQVEIKTFPFNKDSLDSISNENYVDYPVVYFLNNNTTVYIGETVAVRNRMRDHLSNQERKSLEKMTFIIHEKFNQSATYNIETKLINYFLADERYKLQNKSQTTKSVMHNYYKKQYYNEELFTEIWNELLTRKIVDHSSSTIENKDIFKLSPFKELTIEQLELKNKIIEVCEQHIEDDQTFVFLIKGEAGVGKSVVLSSVFNKIQELSKEKSSVLYKTDNHLLVNHSEMLKTYKKIAGNVKALSKKSFDKPTSFINRRKNLKEKADIVLVDEAHLLLTKPDRYNNFNEENQLQEIIRHSKVVIAVYDDKQVLKMKSYWDESRLQDILGECNTEEPYILTNQFRMKASNQMVQWIDHFVKKKITSIPSNPNYDFRIFDSAAEMYKVIQEKNEQHELARIVSTFDYVHKKDGQDYYVEEEGFKLPWNADYGNETWAEKAGTIKEAGSIYTIQGFDLNYVGVILGPSISYDEKTDTLKILTENYKDTEAYRGKDEFEDSEKVKEKIILNSLNVLMKRGIKGLYIYASDEKLRDRLGKLKK
ncbi:DUF2075 family protein/nucleoside-triphosphatase THEP1 [Bacillus mesophilus]|uniref:DUF2075 domain-containing protein n=1 Tax=Bacillus mesophilus TaxID=1808955 RepID=A0A6M0Q6P3_9BACI|nr:DUF2075 domain-containing protein [Bacillus mesophilus]MBM7660413.1 DUF2075 family protein/nucleoside-triphosphatase THEP1 [Bacillus mesophilus]NEY71120.1 DUF2075 domain-containing protein [Bacillus mesophilus]